MCSHCRSCIYLMGGKKCLAWVLNVRIYVLVSVWNHTVSVLYENKSRLVACSMTSTMVTAVDLDLVVPPGVEFQNMDKKHGAVQWTLIRQAEIVSWIDTWEVIVEPVRRWPCCQTLLRIFTSLMVMPAGCASDISPLQNSTVVLFRRVALTTVGWNRDQFCENSTMLFTVSENGVYWLKFPRAHLTQCKVYHSHYSSFSKLRKST